MRDLQRNLFDVCYRPFLGLEERRDAAGFLTGEFTPQYGEMAQIRASLSAARGAAEQEMFGLLESYDRTMSCADPRCPITESSILWLDGADTNGPHNYVVAKRAVWRNSAAYALRKVKVK